MRPMAMAHDTVAAIRQFQILPHGDKGISLGDQHLGQHSAGAFSCKFAQWIVNRLRLTQRDDNGISRHGVSLLSGGSGRLDARLDTPPSIIRRHPDSCIALTTSLAVLGLSMMLLPSASSFALIAFIGAVAGLPCAAMLVLPTEVLRPQSRAPGMGVFYTWYYVGMTLLTPVAGLARDLSGSPGAPLIFAGSLEIAAIAVLVIFRLLQHRWTSELVLNAEK